ncbi:Uncharacterized protein CLAVI_000879 [Candidatus Clavichlamydia salmonicola]|uniref:outer membrane protein assembly factor BamA n=1 Tax=Candidatus Clavichlamydia salmonicola TaxID=469812 RepID=UPI001890D90E|nr:outer membrane protein assembly factor BamA [Candidatus Clavichlamydia salmonicola]MBF5051238.1 Uncharacterized protein [Candidatus Clavichlamydia salmonicola]
MKRILFPLFLICQVVALQASSYEEDPVVDKIIFFKDEETFSVEEFNPYMTTKPGKIFSQNHFDQDLKKLEKKYDRVSSILEMNDNSLVIKVSLHNRPILKKISISGNQAIPYAKIERILGLKIKASITREEIVTAMAKLRKSYLKQGYFETECSFKLDVIDKETAHVHITINEGRIGKISRITYIGISPEEQMAIKEKMLTRPYEFGKSFLKGNGFYIPDMAEHDRLRITQFFQNKGYADAAVKISIDESMKNKAHGLYLNVHVSKNEQYKVGDVLVEGAESLEDDWLFPMISVRTGQIYSPEQLWSSVEKIKEFYQLRGFFNTIVEIKQSITHDEAVYNVCFSIKEGVPCKIGLIKVFGNVNTQSEVILNESVLFPGDLLDKKKIENTERRIRNTGFFSTVNVYTVQSQIDPEDTNADYKDIYIEVDETSTGSVGVFLGCSSFDNLFGGVELSEKNFSLKGLPFVFFKGPNALRGGGEYFHIKANIGQKTSDYSVNWVKPHFMDFNWTLGVAIDKGANKALSSNYEVETFGGNLSATYLCSDFMKYGFYYRANHSYLRHLYPSSNIINSSSVNGPTSPSTFVAREGSNDGLVSALGFSVAYDTTNSPRMPTHGKRSRLAFEVAGFGGDFNFIKFTYLNTFYNGITPRAVFKFKSDLQFIKSCGDTLPTDIPMSERFFLGGETTLRGYKSFIVGPKFSAREPKGGLSYSIFSEEFQYKLLMNPDFYGFAFIDAGYLSSKELSWGTSYAMSIGFGARFNVLANIPVMLGVGWPLHAKELYDGVIIDNSQRFFFSLGGLF